MGQDLVTVCMPVYNGEKFIGDAIAGVLNQTYKHLELLIIDDGSTDGTMRVVKKFQDSRIRIISNEENKGLIYCRNLGIKEARGVFFAFNDSDDISLPERIEIQVSHFLRNPEIGLCGASAYLINEDDLLLGDINVVTGVSEYLRCLLLFSNLFLNSSIVFLTETLKNYTYHLPLAEDYDLTTRLAYDGVRLSNLSSQLIKYRTHDLNISKSRFLELKKNELIILKTQLNRLRYEPTSEELELHYCFLSNDFQSYTFSEVESWLNKLNTLNKQSRLYPNKPFQKVLFQQLYKYTINKKSRVLYLRLLFTRSFCRYFVSNIIPIQSG